MLLVPLNQDTSPSDLGHLGPISDSTIYVASASLKFVVNSESGPEFFAAFINLSAALMPNPKAPALSSSHGSQFPDDSVDDLWRWQAQVGSTHPQAGEEV